MAGWARGTTFLQLMSNFMVGIDILVADMFSLKRIGSDEPSKSSTKVGAGWGLHIMKIKGKMSFEFLTCPKRGDTIVS
jgi:hypothetical protein